MAAEVEPTQQPALLDTTVLAEGMSESPMVSNETPPTPRIVEPQSPSDSGSDYSEDFQSPENSRPTSLEPQAAQGYVVVTQYALSETVHGEVSNDQDSDDRPRSPSAVGEVEGIEADMTPITAEIGAVTPALPQSDDTFKDVPLEDVQHTTTVQTPEEGPSTGQLQDSNDADEAPVTSSTAADRTTPEAKAPSIHVTSRPMYPDGSDYSGSPSHSPVSPVGSSVPISPMTPQEAHMSIDSMHSIALSESSLDYDHLSSDQVDDVLRTPRISSMRHLRKPSSLEILGNSWGPPMRQETMFDVSKDVPETPADELDQDDTLIDTTSAWRSESASSIPTLKRDSGSSDSDLEQFDWQALDKTEEQEKEDKDLQYGAEDESTAFLLARLEQENAKFSADPKSAVGSAIPKHMARVRSQSRPPSMAHLKKLVSKQDTPSIRYSLAPDVQQQLPLEDPPPMTELEFWAALVQDYPSTASRLPTLTTTKIRAGIPLPLRGVVWTSMSGARDKALEDAFEKLQHEKSPYEGIINKDVGRSFPGVELFRDADGEGQRMLGRVLKCYSLHDKDIGYCQGLGFLVGPLLMNMGEKEAFCVLVRLMEHYALRPSFLPSLSGLHMRIFQFSTLLKQHHPELSDHLTELGVEPAYLSQWFLSCFAVTCPLPMLFRIYDVIFAEGANETVMRVALALFRRNEEKMMASTEFEEVMQLLLGRALWDVYGLNADDLIDDFTSLGNIITHQRLAELEKEFETKDSASVGQFAGFLPDVQAAASRFLGRLWAPSHISTPSKGATLSPSSAERETGTPMSSILSRPGSFLRRSPSKTSIGTINESSASDGSGANSIASTAPTEAEIHDAEARESQADSASMKSKAESLRTVSLSTNHAQTAAAREQQELHSQIEDLLVAISEMQREHAQMAAMLQKEREERNDDHRVVRKLVAKMGRGRPSSRQSKEARKSMPPIARMQLVDVDAANKRRTLPARPRPGAEEAPEVDVEKEAPPKESTDDLDQLVSEVQSRLNSNARFSASFETKAQLRANLTRTHEQLRAAEDSVKMLSERAEFAEASLATYQGESENLRSEVEELRARVNDDFKEKQKLELTIQNMEIQMRMEAKALETKMKRASWISRTQSSGEVPTMSRTGSVERPRTGSITSQPGNAGGLRELKLGRRDSSSSMQSGRSTRNRRQTEEWPVSPVANSGLPSPQMKPAETTKPQPPVEPPPSPTPAVVQISAPPSPAPRPVQPAAPAHKPSASLSVPGPGGFAPRTSSLATKAVLASPSHEPVPDEALLLELVNAKTSEAQARQEVDELRKTMQVQKRKTDEALLQIQAEIAAAKLEAEAARAEAARAKAEAQAARAEVFDASPLATPMSFPSTPGPILEEGPSDFTTPAKKPEPKKADSAPTSAGGGWFWSRRTASTTKATIEKTSE